MFDKAIAQFAVAYADQNECDYLSLVDAAAGRVTAEQDDRARSRRAAAASAPGVLAWTPPPRVMAEQDDRARSRRAAAASAPGVLARQDRAD